MLHIFNVSWSVHLHIFQQADQQMQLVIDFWHLYVFPLGYIPYDLVSRTVTSRREHLPLLIQVSCITWCILLSFIRFTIFKDEMTGSCMCFLQHIYMLHVNKVQPIRIAAIRVTCLCVAKDIYMIRYFHP
jgi:hypothetical protein